MSAPCPKIVTYQLSGVLPKLNAPSWLAFYVDRGDLLPAKFEGDTQDAAIAEARGWWAGEQAAVAKARAARGEAAA